LNNGHEFKLPRGGEVRVRRCFSDVEDGMTELEIVEFTIETFHPYWFLSSLLLSPAEAALLGSALVAESVKELEVA
jgi:hypothetical protein